MNRTVKKLSAISMGFCGVYLLVYILVIVLQYIYLPDGLEETFYFPLLSTGFSYLFGTIIIIANIILIVKQFNYKNCVMPVVLTGTAYGIYSLCASFFPVLDNFIAIEQSANEAAGISYVNGYLTLFTSFPLTVMSVLAIVSAAINCYHCKLFKEELH